LSEPPHAHSVFLHSLKQNLYKQYYLQYSPKKQFSNTIVELSYMSKIADFGPDIQAR